MQELASGAEGAAAAAGGGGGWAVVEELAGRAEGAAAAAGRGGGSAAVVVAAWVAGRGAMRAVALGVGALAGRWWRSCGGAFAFAAAFPLALALAWPLGLAFAAALPNRRDGAKRPRRSGARKAPPSLLREVTMAPAHPITGSDSSQNGFRYNICFSNRSRRKLQMFFENESHVYIIVKTPYEYADESIPVGHGRCTDAASRMASPFGLQFT